MESSQSECRIFLSVRQIIADLFDIPYLDIALTTSRDDVERWDSLQHVNLILDIESHFGVHFTEEQVLEMWTVEQLVQHVQNSIVANSKPSDF